MADEKKTSVEVKTIKKDEDPNAPLFEGTLFLSPNIDYFQNGDDFFVYHNIYGYILKMSEDLVDFLEFFYDSPKSAADMSEAFGETFDRDTLNNFLSIFRTLACLLPNDQFEAEKTHDMYPTKARWIAVDQTDAEAVVIYAFDTQSQNTVIKIALDKWESKLWGFIKGNKTVGEIAREMAEEDAVSSADEEIRITAALAQWSHSSIQAIKLSAEACANFQGRRFGVPPYLISTMPYPKVTADVRTRVDEKGNILQKYEEPVRVMPQNINYIHIDQNTLKQDHDCARLASLLAEPHPVLGGKSYGNAVYDVLTQYVPITGELCSILEVGGGRGDTARALVSACAKNSPDTQIKYIIFNPNQDEADFLADTLKDLPQISVVSGDINKIADILSGNQFDIIYSDEFIANLPSDNVRKMIVGGEDPDDDEDIDNNDVPDTSERELKPAHASDDKITFIGEGDSVSLILKYKLKLFDAPEDFVLNTGSLRLLGNLAKLSKFSTQMFIVEFGEDIKYPVLTLEDGRVTWSQQFGILKQAAEKLGFRASSTYWMEEMNISRDVKMFATTRSQFKAMRQLLADNGVDLQRHPYTEQEFKDLLKMAGRTDVVEVNYEPAEERISGLVPHAYKLLRVYKELEF